MVERLLRENMVDECFLCFVGGRFLERKGKLLCASEVVTPFCLCQRGTNFSSTVSTTVYNTTARHFVTLRGCPTEVRNAHQYIWFANRTIPLEQLHCTDLSDLIVSSEQHAEQEMQHALHLSWTESGLVLLFVNRFIYSKNLRSSDNN